MLWVGGGVVGYEQPPYRTNSVGILRNLTKRIGDRGGDLCLSSLAKSSDAHRTLEVSSGAVTRATDSQLGFWWLMDLGRTLAGTAFNEYGIRSTLFGPEFEWPALLAV